MALELRQQQKLSQQLIMTPQLRMAITLLQLSRQELLETINEQLEENPALEEELPDESAEDAPEGQVLKPTETPLGEASPEREVPAEEKIIEEIDWSRYFEESERSGRTSYEGESRQSPAIDTFTAYRESLCDHLLGQLMMTAPSPTEKDIGELIAGNLDSEGYLDATVEELAESSGYAVEMVELVLAKMQTFDPIGVCARDRSECLRIQALRMGHDNAIVISVIDHHLDSVANRNYKAICRALKVRMDEVIAAVDIIRGLDPKPARQYGGEEPQYIEPDIYVVKEEDEEDGFRIELNDDGLPRLRTSNLYRDALTGKEHVTDSAKEYIQDKMRHALWLMRSIKEREKTIYRVMESILKFQKEFFEKGILSLRPMVLRDVAQDIDKHESTISRVTTNKYAHTPQGIFELKFFFNSSINRVYGDAIASASVQEKIRQVIEQENTAKPFSDQEIANRLKADNINIARRTVAKYREAMKILPSSKRKQI